MTIATHKEPAVITVYQTGIMARFAKLLRRFALWRARRTTMQALSSLDDHTLKDIGLHRSQITAVVQELGREAARDADRPRVPGENLPLAHRLPWGADGESVS